MAEEAKTRRTKDPVARLKAEIAAAQKREARLKAELTNTQQWERKWLVNKHTVLTGQRAAAIRAVGKATDRLGVIDAQLSELLDRLEVVDMEIRAAEGHEEPVTAETTISRDS